MGSVLSEGGRARGLGVVVVVVVVVVSVSGGGGFVVDILRVVGRGILVREWRSLGDL